MTTIVTIVILVILCLVLAGIYGNKAAEYEAEKQRYALQKINRYIDRCEPNAYKRPDLELTMNDRSEKILSLSDLSDILANYFGYPREQCEVLWDKTSFYFRHEEPDVPIPETPVVRLRPSPEDVEDKIVIQTRGHLTSEVRRRLVEKWRRDLENLSRRPKSANLTPAEKSLDDWDGEAH